MSIDIEHIFDLAERGVDFIKNYIEENKIDVTAVRNSRGETLLHTAAKDENSELAEYLISKGLNVDVKSDNSQTPLHLAACYGTPAMAEFLVSKGADINATDKYGFTPLHHASDYSIVKEGHVKVVKYLLSKKAFTSVKTKQGNTPLMLARRNAEFYASKAEYATYLARDNEIIECLSATSASGSCYIATAVYNSYDAPEVLCLRKYRDEILSTSILGRLFIKTYYLFSPPVAERLKKTRHINIFVRKILDKFIKTLSKKFND